MNDIMVVKALVFIPPNTPMNRQSQESSLISTAMGLVSTRGVKPCVCCTGQPEIEELEELKTRCFYESSS